MAHLRMMLSTTCAAAFLLTASTAALAAPDWELALEEFLGEYARTCAGPEGVTDCALPGFKERFADRLEWMNTHREALTRTWREQLQGGSHVPAYGLALLGDKDALPALRTLLLADRYFYGWESSHPNDLAVRMRDEQYPHHMAMLGAIETLAGMSATKWVAATPEECAVLQKEVKAGSTDAPADVARWLSRKLCSG